MWTGSAPNRDPQGFYALLGVEPDADMEEIKKKYKALAIKWHPDKNPSNAVEATERFQKISLAYDTLSDPRKREDYDSSGYYGTSSSRRDVDCFSRRNFRDLNFGHPFVTPDSIFENAFNNMFQMPGVFARGAMPFNFFDDFGAFDVPSPWYGGMSSSSRRSGFPRRQASNVRRSSNFSHFSSSVTTTERILPDGSVEVTTTEESVDRDGTRTRTTRTEIRPPRSSQNSRMAASQQTQSTNNVTTFSTSGFSRRRSSRNLGDYNFY